MSAAFYVVRVDNLSQLFSAVFDAARWPVGVFRGVVRVALHVRRPARAHDDDPAEALLGTPARRPHWRARSGRAALAFAISRMVWNRSIARYTSAGG